MLVSRKDKIGLYSYNKDDESIDWISLSEPTDTEKKDEDDLITPESIEFNHEYGKTSAKVLLPIIYDDIELRQSLIIVKKDNKYGIYPLKNGLKYKHLGEIDNNFIPYKTVDNEKGWIDINTGKEYPHKLQ